LKKQDSGKIKPLAKLYSSSEKNYYFKWVIANRLARLSHDLLKKEENNNHRLRLNSINHSNFPVPIKQYLIAGLDNSIMRYIPRKFLFMKREKSPLDLDIDQILTYLESQLE
jgi:hypothetical protein